MNLHVVHRNPLRRLVDMITRRHPTPETTPLLTKGEMLSVLDERARRLLNLSATEFLTALDDGTLAESPAVSHLSILAGRTRSA